MANRKEIARASFYSVDETCPKVDAAMDEAANKIKEQTSALRDALDEWIGRALDAEEKIVEPEDQLTKANEEIERLREFEL